MSRTKKSRKPSFAPASAPKEDKKKTVIVSDKKPKKKTGKESGNRQKEATRDNKAPTQNNQSKDPRIGSKKPIELGGPVPTSKPKIKNKPLIAKKSPMAAIRDVETNDSLEQALYAIEEDNQLQAIIVKQEDDIALTEAEVDYFNEKMAKHTELREALGWNDDDEEAEPTKSSNSDNDEDALWDKLDTSDFSDYE